MSETNEQQLNPGRSEGQSGASSVPPGEQRADGANATPSPSTTKQAQNQGSAPGQNTGRDSRSEARR